MAQMLMSYPSTSLKCGDFSRGRLPWERKQSRAYGVQCCSCSSSTEEVGVFGKVENEKSRSRSREIKEIVDDEKKLDCLVSEYGWQVRRLVVEDGEMRRVASVQAQAFYSPVLLFNDIFFEFFKDSFLVLNNVHVISRKGNGVARGLVFLALSSYQAEVLSGLLYKLKNSSPDRYACLVAEPSTSSAATRESQGKLVGVVDVTVQREEPVLQHLPGAQEFLYISGLAVSKSFRRQKVASVMLKACDMLASLWGYEYLALRAYEEDLGAQTLYSKAGYQVASGDPPWMSTWIGRKRRVLMIKRLNI